MLSWLLSKFGTAPSPIESGDQHYFFCRQTPIFEGTHGPGYVVKICPLLSCGLVGTGAWRMTAVTGPNVAV